MWEGAPIQHNDDGRAAATAVALATTRGGRASSPRLAAAVDMQKWLLQAASDRSQARREWAALLPHAAGCRQLDGLPRTGTSSELRWMLQAAHERALAAEPPALASSGAARCLNFTENESDLQNGCTEASRAAAGTAGSPLATAQRQSVWRRQAAAGVVGLLNRPRACGPIA